MVGNTTENTYSDDSLLSRLDRSLAKIEDFFTLLAAIVILALMLFGTLNAIFRKGPKVLTAIFESLNIPIEIYSFPIWGYTDLVQLNQDLMQSLLQMYSNLTQLVLIENCYTLVQWGFASPSTTSHAEDV